MKIMQICQSYPPMISGAAVAFQQLAEGLVELEQHVMVVAASDRGEGYSRHTNELCVERLPSWPNPMRVGQRFIFQARQRLSTFMSRWHLGFLG